MKKLIIITIPILLTLTIILSLSNNITTKYDEVEKAYTADLTSEETIIEISIPMTYQEIINKLSHDKYITVPVISSNSDLDNSSENNAGTSDESKTSVPAIALDPNITYRLVSIEFNASNDKEKYRPKMNIYIRTNEEDNSEDWNIDQVIAASLDTYYKDMKMNFEGTLYTNLEDKDSIFWSINGDFFKEGTFDPNKIQVNFTDDKEITISNDSNKTHFSYCCTEGRVDIN